MDFGTNSFMGQVLAIVSGAILGIVIHRLLGEAAWDMTLEGIPVSGRDLVVFAVSAILMMWGSKVSGYLKYAGAGMFTWQLGHEVKDFIWT